MPPTRRQSSPTGTIAWRGPAVRRPPAAAAVSGPGGSVTAFASWNGATEVATWDVLAGPSAGALKLAGSVPRSGFETSIPVKGPRSGYGCGAQRPRCRAGVIAHRQRLGLSAAPGGTGPSPPRPASAVCGRIVAWVAASAVCGRIVAWVAASAVCGRCTIATAAGS